MRVDDPRRLGDVLVDDHRAIAKAVAAGHATKARTEMLRHVENVIEDIRAHMGDGDHDYVEWLGSGQPVAQMPAGRDDAGVGNTSGL